MGFASAALGVAALGTGVAGAAMGGGGSGGGQLRLPPELEIKFLEQSEQQLAQTQQDLQRTTQLEQQFNQRLDTLQGMIEGSIPEADGIRALQDNTRNLAQAFGGDTQALIESGFLTPEIAQELSDLRALESEDLKDPALENQINEERQKLEQDLARAGVSPAQRSQALRQFERSAEEQRFGRAEELRSGKTQRGLSRISAGLQARESGFQQALSGFGASSSGLEQLFGQRSSGIGALGDLAGSRFGAGQQTLQNRAGLRAEGRDVYQQLGGFDFSGRVKDALESGLIGPGSLFQQTGIAAREQDAYRGAIQKQEEEISKKRIGASVNQAQKLTGIGSSKTIDQVRPDDVVTRYNR